MKKIMTVGGYLLAGMILADTQEVWTMDPLKGAAGIVMAAALIWMGHVGWDG